MGNLKQHDFTSCLFDPTSAGFVKDLIDEYKEFASYKGENKKSVFTYVVILYDKESPLWAMEKEYFRRKVLAAELSGLPTNDNGGFKKDTKEILEGQNDDVNKLVVAYLASTGNLEFQMLISDMVMFNGYQAKVLKGQYDKDTYKVMEAIKDGMEKRTRKIFGSGDKDELERVRVMLYEAAEKERQRLQPEAVVKMVEKDGDVPDDWSPYGTDYKVEDLKYYHGETEG